NDLGGEINVLHFDTGLQTFVRQDYGHGLALGEAPFTAAIKRVFFFKEIVTRPLDLCSEVLGQQQPDLIGIRTLRRTAFLCPWRRGRSFFVTERADAEFVLDEDCWIERDLVPIGQGVASLDTGGGGATTSVKSFKSGLS